MTSPQWTEADERFMRRAIELSRRGYPAPNPHVGCVLVKDGTIIGEGWHEYAGDDHAEVAALKRSSDPRGCTAYVTLEPCNHQGRTGPCSLALIEAGVSHVIFACADPNPKAVGGGERLRQHGVLTSQGLLEDEAASANEQFLFAMAQKRPLVVLKAACSMDGRISLPNGESKWITGPEARNQGHVLRAELGAVLVGRGTVQADNPQLTARLEGVHNQPKRIVLDPNNRLSGKEKVFNDEAETIHVTGSIDLPELLSTLFNCGITGVLVEGGAVTIGHFVREGIFERVELFLAPNILGSGKSWVEGFSREQVPEEPELVIVSTRSMGADLWLTARKA